MKTTARNIRVSTEKTVGVTDVTRLIRQALGETGMQTGICLVSTPHTTCGLTVNEFESGLVRDIEKLAGELLHPLTGQSGFHHDRVDNNAQAHLTSGLLGRSLSLPVHNGDLHLGTWQSVLLVECDGPRNRTIDMTFLGE